MDPVWDALLKYPPLAGLVIVVIIFLRFLERQRKELELISASCHSHHDAVVDRMIKAIDTNSEMIQKNCQAFGEVLGALRRLNGKEK